MIVVIVAGGSGTRLWPVSTPEYPKHLLKINGDDRSLLQKSYERAKRLADKIYVVSEAGHINYVKEQLPELSDKSFIVEPARRGTANCIILALHRIAQEHDANEPISFLWADHYIRDKKGFERSFRLAAKASQAHKRIVLVGVEPDHPATGFGYIEKGEPLDDKGSVFEVKSFKEKPEYRVAQDYLKSGNYLWNCGYIVGSCNVFLENMKSAAPDLLQSYQRLQVAQAKDIDKIYLDFETDAIDYALTEKAKGLLVVPAAFDWMDLGSFNDMHKAVESDERGNHVHGAVHLDEVENSFVQNHEDKPVAVIGLDNVVVVNTPHGILVARKDLSQRVGEIAKKLNG